MAPLHSPAWLTPALQGGALRTRSHPQIAPTVWGWLVDGMNALLRAALADPGNAHFAFLSPTTVPVKPFPEVYAAIVGPGQAPWVVSYDGTLEVHGNFLARRSTGHR